MFQKIYVYVYLFYWNLSLVCFHASWLFGRDLLKTGWCRKFRPILSFIHHFMWKFILKLSPFDKGDFREFFVRLRFFLIIVKVQINKNVKMGLFQNVKLNLWFSKLKDNTWLNWYHFSKRALWDCSSFPMHNHTPKFRISNYFHRRPKNSFLN